MGILIYIAQSVVIFIVLARMGVQFITEAGLSKYSTYLYIITASLVLQTAPLRSIQKLWSGMLVILNIDIWNTNMNRTISIHYNNIQQKIITFTKKKLSKIIR